MLCRCHGIRATGTNVLPASRPGQPCSTTHGAGWGRHSQAGRRKERNRLCASVPAPLARLLHRWAWHVAVGAKDTAIPRLRPQYPVAAMAFVEILAGIGRHGFFPAVAAGRTGQRRFTQYGFHFSSRSQLMDSGQLTAANKKREPWLPFFIGWCGAYSTLALARRSSTCFCTIRCWSCCAIWPLASSKPGSFSSRVSSS